MATIPNTEVKFSSLQTVLGGTNPISMSEYFADATTGFSTGVVGIPNKFSAIGMSVFRGKSKGPVLGLYAFTSHTFTNANVIGWDGPTLSQCRTAYSSATWAQNTNKNYLNMTTTGIQEWKVPATGTYTIECAGAQGGGVNSPGKGAIIRGTFNLTEGTTLFILVGQIGGREAQSSAGGVAGGGGGGTFISLNSLSGTLLMVAGGGGGRSRVNGGDASYSQTSSATGGTAGGAGNNGQAYGGAGYNGETSSLAGGDRARSYLNGGRGGWGLPDAGQAFGGFGGGGGEGQFDGGGGGGYTGGNSGDDFAASGGGGSYIDSSGADVQNVGYNTSHGYVTITANFTIIDTLYSFTSHTFTNASATGWEGPTLSQCRSAYSSASWTQDTTNNWLNMTRQGTQLWTVPATGSYIITANGARGGSVENVSTGGNGARLIGTFSLRGREVIRIIVGQMGVTSVLGITSGSAGGGGGSFVVRSTDDTTNSILVIAGGGGGAASGNSSIDRNGVGGTTDTSGTRARDNFLTPATNGNGGPGDIQSWGGAGGGGFVSSGGDAKHSSTTVTASGGDKFAFGSRGGISRSGGYGTQGGFGGGGGASWGAGGGGGFSGGAADSSVGTGTDKEGGGGGGSYNSGLNQTNQSGVNSTHGSVTISLST